MTALEELREWIEGQLVIIDKSGDLYEDGQFLEIIAPSEGQLLRLIRLAKLALSERLEARLQELNE